MQGAERARRSRKRSHACPTVSVGRSLYLGWICQNSGLWHHEDPDLGLMTPTLRYEVGRLLALQHATIGLWHRQGPDPGLTMPALRYEVGRLLALQNATIGLEP